MLIYTLKKINIFDKENKNLKNSFLFFFFIALCGYASIMLSISPYNDDYCRYVANMPVGTLFSARYTTRFLEILMYFSEIVTDAAPFTQILSCAFLSYSAIVCMKILNINDNDNYAKACMIPIVVNPYLLECMMFRFDSPFMMLALFCSVMSAYLTSVDGKKMLLIQVILLLHSLLLYQVAISAYFIICTYLFLIELSKNVSVLSAFLKMKYWLYTLLITAISYLPITTSISYFKKDGRLLLNPLSGDDIKCICENIELYIGNLRTDWAYNPVGQFFIAALIVFSLFFLIDVFKNLKNKTSIIFRCLLIIIFLFIFFMMPFGFSSCLVDIKRLWISSICPRMLCCFGFLISIVLYKNYSTIRDYKILKNLYMLYLCCFGMWNLIFLNSAGNIIHCYRKLQELVLYDVSNDISDILNDKNNHFSKFCINGAISSVAMKNFAELYPMIYRIIPDRWSVVKHCAIALFNHKIADCLIKYGLYGGIFKEYKWSHKALLKSHLWYDVYSIDNEILLFELKNNKNFRNPDSQLLRIKE